MSPTYLPFLTLLMAADNCRLPVPTSCLFVGGASLHIPPSSCLWSLSCNESIRVSADLKACALLSTLFLHTKNSELLLLFFPNSKKIAPPPSPLFSVSFKGVGCEIGYCSFSWNLLCPLLMALQDVFFSLVLSHCRDTLFVVVLFP